MPRLTEQIAKPFWSAHRDIMRHGHTEYIMYGGRGSAKSSFIGLEILLLIKKNPDCHAIIFRKIGNTLSKSVYSQIGQCIDRLGLAGEFEQRTSPFSYIYKPTGQQILFFGLQDKDRLKSINMPFGYFGISWFEELDQFSGPAELRSVNQSILRGGPKYWQFKSYNPPKSRDNWVNIDILVDRPQRFKCASNYLDIPKQWLGEEFLLEAEQLKKERPDLYAHEYMGEVTGTGGDIFRNVEDLRMSDDMIKTFDNIRHGADFGFAHDPFAYNKMYWDSKHQYLYIFAEVYGIRMSNEVSQRKIKPYVKNDYVTGDSAEPKTIAWYNSHDVRMLACHKADGSRDYGIKWLSDLPKIYIDKKRCPNTYREFVNYEFARDKDGNFISEYPKKNDHSIDAVRYGMDRDMQSLRVSATRVD